MTSNVTEAFVWIWLPGSPVPVVAGRVEKHGPLHHFTYGRSYRERDDAIALSPFELPLQAGTFEPVGMNTIHSCLRDAAPDAWGRRVFILQHNIYGVFNITPYNNCFIRSLFIYSV